MLAEIHLLLQITATPARAQYLRTRLTALCPLPAAIPPNGLWTRDSALATDAASSVEDARWRDIGCTRALLGFAGTSGIKVDEVGLPFGDSWMQGATAAFLKAWEQDAVPGDLERLALAAQMSLGSKPAPPWLQIDQVATTILGAIEQGDTNARVLTACPILLLAVSDTASARECVHRAGGDPRTLPTVTQLHPEINLQVVLYRLWNPVSGEPIALATFSYQFETATADQNIAIECRKRVAVRPGVRCLPGERLPLPLEQVVNFTQWDPTDNAWFRDVHPTLLDTAKVTRLAKLRFSGYRWATTTPNVTAWAVGVRQDNEGVGARRSVGTLEPIIKSAMYLSDVVFGSEPQITRAAIGGDSIWLAPFEVVDRKSPVHLYFQVGSAMARPSAKTTLRMTLEGATKASSDNGVQFMFATPIVQGITGVQKELVVDRLLPGAYRFEVEVTDPATSLVTSQVRRLVLR